MYIIYCFLSNEKNALYDSEHGQSRWISIYIRTKKLLEITGVIIYLI